jgi:dTMP kinase
MAMDEVRVPGGLLIAIEGIDGAGKTTLAAALAQRLRDCGLRVVGSKEPTHGPHGTALRNTAASGRLSAAEELELLLADRRQHVQELIAPALAAGQAVLLDRYYYSNMAYQGAEGLDPAAIRECNAFAPEPDLVLLLDLPVATGLQRIAVRGDTANAFETASTLEAVRRLFLDIVPAPPRGAVIDARDGADQVLDAALQAVVQVMAGKLGRDGAACVDALVRRPGGAAQAD